MNRFQFRAWDKRTDRMIGGVKLPEEWYINNYPTMQCTCLKDKNGKLIFEGDVIQSKSELVKIVTGRRTGKIKTENYIIEWEQARGRWGRRYNKNNRLELFSMRQELLTEYYTIIGNIYENPELLKGE